MASAAITAEKGRKINLTLSEKSFEEVRQMAEQNGRSMSDIIRFGISLTKLYFDEKAKGNSLYIGTESGKAIMRIVFP